MKQVIKTEQAPQAIGAYSQAVRVGDTVYLSGQIGLNPKTAELVSDDMAAQTQQVFENLQAVTQAAGGNLNKIVKLTVYLTDLADYAKLNEIMGEFFEAPFPARAAVAVSALPKGACVEVDGVMCLD